MPNLANPLRGKSALTLLAIFDLITLVAYVAIAYIACAGVIDVLTWMHAWHLGIVLLVIVMGVLDHAYEPLLVAVVALVTACFDAYVFVTRVMSPALMAFEVCALVSFVFDGVLLLLAFLFILAALFTMPEYGCFGNGDNEYNVLVDEDDTTMEKKETIVGTSDAYPPSIDDMTPAASFESVPRYSMRQARLLSKVRATN